MALSTSATESLLRAVDIIASSKLGEVSYDQTIICTIVDNSEVEKRGFYTVTDGKVRFKAYTDVTTYQIGDQIRVTIPNGDFNAKKYIDGAYASDDDSSAPITYVSPLDSFLSMAELESSVQNVKKALKANDPNLQGQSILIWTTKLANSVYSDLQNNGIYDAIGLSADFKCWLGAYDMKSGNYGLRLDIKVKVNNTENYIVKSFYLDSNEMFGNPYNFIAPSTQEKMFNITSVGTITEMSLYFYQSNNFMYYDPNTEGLENIPVQAEYNIFVDNIKVALGTNIANVADNTLKIYTSSNTDFNYLNPIDQTNLKKIGLLWYNKNELNQYLGFSDGIVDFKVDQNGNFIPVDGEEDKYVIKPYDEIEYLQKSKKNTRWKSQLNKNNVPKDPAGLELAALSEEAFIAVEEIKTLINEDLINALENYQKKFKQRLPEAFTIIDNDYISPLQNGDTSFIKTFDTTLNVKKKYLEDMLAYVAKMQRVQNGESWEADNIQKPESGSDPHLVDLIGSEFERLKEIHNNALNNFKTLVSKDEYQNFTSSYDSFEKSINDIINLIKIKVEEVKQKAEITDIQINQYPKPDYKEYTPLEEALSWYNINDYVGVYNPLEDSEHSNRYCIYWYRYVPGYIDPNPEFAFAGPEWERITKVQISSNEGEDSIYTIPNNLGLSNDYLPPKDGIYYWEKRPENNEGMLNVYLEPKMYQEKFKAILFYNHDKYESEPIVFTNVDDITSIYADKTGALSIEHIEDSSDTYQTMYSANNFLTNRANAKKNRAVRAVYNGTLGTTEDVLVNAENPAHIYWYIPIENTMINVDLDYLAKPESEGGAGFTTNYVPTYRFKPGILERLWKWNEWLKKQNNKQLEFLQDRPYRKQTIPNLYTFDEWIKFLQGKLDDIENPIAEYNNFEDLKLPNAFKGFKKVGNFLSLTEDFSMKELVRENEILKQSGGKWLPFPFKMKLPILDDAGEIIPGSEQEAEEEDLIDEIKDDEHHRDGYAYFYKKIEAIDYIKNADDEKEENLGIKDNEFFYQIKNYYSKNETNNQIICLVEKNGETFEASLNIAFGTQGALGADYSFTIDPTGRQSAVRPDKSLQVNISLFDYDNNQIPIYEYDIAATEENDYAGIAYLEKTNVNNEENDNKSYIKWIGKPYDFNLKEDENNHVIGGEISYKDGNQIGSILQLTASFKNNENGDTESSVPGGSNDYKKKKLSNITTFYSVPYSSADFYIEGATSVIYDSNGNNPDYYKKPYKIFYNYYKDIKENGEIITHPMGQEITDVEWKIAYCEYNEKEKIFTYLDEKTHKKQIQFCENCLPVLNDKNILTPCATYIDDKDANIKYYAFIQCWNTPSESEPTLIWSQPIIVRKNRYAANMENSYDSSLAINLDTGTIISSLMNAFRRGGSNSNSLQGFLVGDLQVTKKEDNKDITKNYLGLYGFNNGQQSFGFGIDGSAVIGKDGAARILFQESDIEEERKYQILSSSFMEAMQGLKIDLEDGIIDIYGTMKDSKERTEMISVAPNNLNSFFPNFSTKFSYKNLNSGTKKATPHIYINAASSISENGYTKPDSRKGFPDWWFSHSLGGFYPSLGQHNISTIASNDQPVIDAKNALFKIEVPSDSEDAKDNDGYKPLLLISDQNCLIQSNNYTTGKYTWDTTGGSVDKIGEGMRIDLSYGTIDAYKLKISSNNILVNSSGDKDPLFVVRTTDCKNLMYVEDNDNKQEFYLQSSDYRTKTKTESGKGLKFDIRNGTIESYNFSLRGETAADDNNQYAGSYIHITSNNEEGEPALRFHLKDKKATSEKIKTNGIDLLHITPRVFVLHSTDYDPVAGTGLELDIANGRIESYNFSLKGQATDNVYGGSYIWITSDTKPDDKSTGMPKIEFKLIKNSDGTKIDMSLLSISPEEFFLISPNFDSGDGIKLDILNGTLGIRKKIENEIIDLMLVSAESFKLTSPGFTTGSGMELDIVNGSINIKTEESLSLLDISSSSFSMSSPNWQENTSGMQIDLMSGKIIMNQNNAQKLIINSQASLYPLQIGPVQGTDEETGEEYLKFRVQWNGAIFVGDQNLDIGAGGNDFVIGGSSTAQSFTATGSISAGTTIYADQTITANGGLVSNTTITAEQDISTDGTLIGRSLSIINNSNNQIANISNDGTLSVKSANITGATNIKGKLSIKNNSNNEIASITQEGALIVNSVTVSSGTGTFKTLEVTSTSNFAAIATFKKGINIGPIDDIDTNETQEYYITIAPNTLNKNLSMQKLEVQTININDIEIQVLVAPSGVTEAWAFCNDE